MFRNKLLNAMIMILLVITLLGVVALVTVNVFYANENEDVGTASIDDIIKYSVDFEEITTNLQSGGYLRVKFKVQTDGNKGRVELEKREFQVKNIVIHEISTKNASDFVGGEGIENLEKDIQAKLNEVMQDGAIVKVYTTSFLLQK